MEEQFKNLLRILKLTGGKYIIVEDGVPKAVLMDYKDFEDLMVEKVAGDLVRDLSEIEEINKQITRAQLSELKDGVAADDRPETIRVEPLPDLDLD